MTEKVSARNKTPSLMLNASFSKFASYEKALFGLWLVCVFSLFIPVQIYVPFFALFIVGGGIFALNATRRRELTRRYVGFLIVTLSFILVASFVYVTRRDYSDLEQYIKLVLNSSFLIVTILFFELRKNATATMLRVFTVLLQVIIWLSALQVLRNVAVLGAWFWPLGSTISNSVAAYQIVEPGIFFGSPEKNIWATKIALFVCLYTVIVYQQKRIFRLVPLITIGAGLLGVLYTFSRTAQLSIAILIVLLAYLYAYQRKFWFFRYMLIGGFLIAVIPFYSL